MARARSQAVWPDQLDAGEQAALDAIERRALSDGDRRPDVLVVGGGMVGLATALACRRAGLGHVVVLEKDRLAGGATGGAGGILAPDAHHGVDAAPFVDLGRASLAEWRRLEASTAGGVGLSDIDWLLVDPLPGAVAANPPPGAERVADLRDFDPALGATGGGMLLPRQARLNPVRAAARLAGEVGTVSTGVSVTGAVCRGDRVARVSTTAGVVSAGVVVFATGVPPTPPSLPDLDLPTPCGRVKGHLLVTEPAPVRLRAPGDPAVQLEDGSLMAGGTLDGGDFSPDVRPEVTEGIRAALDKAVPGARGLRTTHAWCCFRPATEDRLPVVDKAPGLANVWLTYGHYRTGILLAPATGRLLAAWIAGGARPREIGPLGLRAIDAGPARP